MARSISQLIQQATLVGGAAELGASDVGDVLIEGGRITAILPSSDVDAPLLADLPINTEIIDGSGQFLGPGLIDLYSQSGEPGHESRETYTSFRQAATAGGFTRVGLLPTTQPAVDSVSAIASILVTQKTDASDPTEQPDLMPWAAITRGTQGQQLVEFAELAASGAIGFTDARPLTNPVLVRRLLEYMQPLNKPIALWPCDPQIAGSGVAREGIDSLRLGLASVSVVAETSPLATLLEYVAEMSTPIHIMRVSTARSVALIRQAKERGLPITASVAWHHLCFDTEDLEDYQPSLRHDPPLGTPADRVALVDAVKEGVLDAIAIDHSPYTYEEKTVAFDVAPPGAIGLELALPVLWQTFVASGKWSPELLWHRLSTGPAHCLDLAAGRLEVGAIAELTLFNPVDRWTVSAQTLRSLSAFNTPWANQSIQGKVSRVWHG